MTTTLRNAEIELSKQMGDYWASTTTSDGNANGTTLVDTALKAKNNDWIEADRAEMFDEVIEGTYDGEERRASSLNNSDGTLTVLAHGGKIVSGIDYRIHRLFSASDKKQALIAAARLTYPAIYDPISDESKAIDSDDLFKEIDISGLGLADNQPSQVLMREDKTDDGTDWIRLHRWDVDGDGNLWLYEGLCDYDLKIIGKAYLEFTSTAWTATIAIDSPQLDILVAAAAIYLCNQKIMPTDTSGTSEEWQKARAYWADELAKRTRKFGMKSPTATQRYR
jgi:hypothetical protein